MLSSRNLRKWNFFFCAVLTLLFAPSSPFPPQHLMASILTVASEFNFHFPSFGVRLRLYYICIRDEREAMKACRSRWMLQFSSSIQLCFRLITYCRCCLTHIPTSFSSCKLSRNKDDLNDIFVHIFCSMYPKIIMINVTRIVCIAIEALLCGSQQIFMFVLPVTHCEVHLHLAALSCTIQ